MSDVVYFIRHQRLVKIGTTGDIGSRLRQIRTGRGCSIEVDVTESFELLATMPGGRAVERSLHEMFAPLRYHGEWFFLEEPLEAFVDAVSAAEAACALWRARARGPRSGQPDDQLTLRRAVDEGLLPWSWEAARKRMERGVCDPPKPITQVGQTFVYDRGELIAWAARSTKDGAEA